MTKTDYKDRLGIYTPQKHFPCMFDNQPIIANWQVNFIASAGEQP